MKFYIPNFNWDDDIHADNSVKVVNSFDSSNFEFDNFVENLEFERVVSWFNGTVAMNDRYLNEEDAVEAVNSFRIFLDKMSVKDKIAAVYVRKNLDEGIKYTSSKFTVLSDYLTSVNCDDSVDCKDLVNNNRDIKKVTLSNLIDGIKKGVIIAVVFSALDKTSRKVNEYTVFLKSK